MSDKVDGKDTGAAAPNATAGSDVPETETTQPKLYAGKYKTIEETEAAYLEAQRKLTEEGQRASEADKRAQRAELEAAVAKQLNEQARTNAAAHGTTIAEERAKLKVSLNQKLLSDDPAEGVVDGMERMAGALQREIEEREGKLKKELEAVSSKLAELEVGQSPLYQQNRQQIDILARRLGSRQLGIEAFEELAATTTVSLPAAALPGGTAPSRTASTQAQPKYRALTEDEKQARRDMNWTEDEIAADKLRVA